MFIDKIKQMIGGVKKSYQDTRAKYIADTKQFENFKADKQSQNRGIVSPLPMTKNPYSKAITQVIAATPPTKITTKPMEAKKPIQRVIPTTPSPTPIPSGVTRLDPITPQNIPSTQYTNRNAKIEPKLWDAIMSASPSGDLQLNDYMKRMALALATQESGGGYTLEGDSGKSNGPYHIQRANVPVTDRYDPVEATKLVFAEMMRNMVKNDVPKERSLRTWNWNSGYVPSWTNAQGIPQYGPKYNVDIPQMATTSSFFRAK